MTVESTKKYKFSLQETPAAPIAFLERTSNTADTVQKMELFIYLLHKRNHYDYYQIAVLLMDISPPLTFMHINTKVLARLL